MPARLLRAAPSARRARLRRSDAGERLRRCSRQKAALGGSTLPTEEAALLYRDCTGTVLGAQPWPRVLELAASKVADFTAFGHAGGGQASAMVSPWPAGAGAVSGPCLAARGQPARASARPARAVAWDGRAVGTTLWVGLGRKHSHAVAWLAPGKLACGAQRPSQDAAAARGLEKTHTRD